jgi:hypothetical protein
MEGSRPVRQKLVASCPEFPLWMNLPLYRTAVTTAYRLLEGIGIKFMNNEVDGTW